MANALKNLKEELGGTGTMVSGGVFDVEYNSKLQFPQSIDEYKKMRADGTVKAVLRACKQPILGAKYSIIPATEEKKDVEIAEFIEQCFFEKIIWRKFLNNWLLTLDFGFSLFEKVFAVDDGKIIIKKFAERLPESVQKWEMEDGQEGITQEAYIDGDLKTISIPREKLLHFANEQEGGNLEGISILRSCYSHWFYKNLFYKLQAMAGERCAVGIPTLDFPENREPSEKELSEIKSTLRRLVGGDDAYIINKGGTKIYFTTPEKSNFDFEQPINHHDRQITKSVLAAFLEIGVTKGGNSQSDSQQDLFFLSLQGIAEEMCEKMNRDIIKQLVVWNFGEQEWYPKLQVSEIGTDGASNFALILERLAGKGLLTPDDLTENALRKMLKLPEKEEGEAPSVEPTPAPKNEKDAEQKIKEDQKKKEKEVKDAKKLSLAEEKPLYVMRKVKNGKEVLAWAKKNGITDILDEKDLHITVAFSKTAVDWKALKKDLKEISVDLKNVEAEKLGDAIVLKFDSKELEKHWKKYIDAGASWEYDGYMPHVSISYSSDQDISKVGKFSGKIVFSGEVFDELDLEEENNNNTDHLSEGLFRELTLAEEKIDITKFLSFFKKQESEVKQILQKNSGDLQDVFLKELKRELDNGEKIKISPEVWKKETSSIAKEIEKKYLESYEFGKTQATKEMGKSERVSIPENEKVYIREYSENIAEKHATDLKNEAVFSVQEQKRISAETSSALKVAKEAMEIKALSQIDLLVPIITNGGVNTGIGTVYEKFKENIWGWQYSSILDSKTSNLCLSLDGRVSRNKKDLPQPPLHYYCRSRLVAVMLDQKEKPKENPPSESMKKNWEGKKWPYLQPKSAEVDPRSPAGKQVRKNEK